MKEGDAVKPGDLLAEIETDKATMEFEAVDEGTVGKILIEEGTEGVAVNTPIAVLIEEGESTDDIDTSGAGTAKPADEKPVEPEAKAPAQAAAPKPMETAPASDEDKYYKDTKEQTVGPH